MTDMENANVAFLCNEDDSYVAAQWGIWRAGGTCVPLCTKHPADELEYVIMDSQVTAVIGHSQFRSVLEPIAQRHSAHYFDVDDLRRRETGADAGDGADAMTGVSADDVSQRSAQIVYTSGTTGKPKGVLVTHGALEAQILDQIESWEWSESDRILHFLPLHHLHGIVNKLCCCLWAGAVCEFMPFDALQVWRRLALSGSSAQGHQDAISLFMAVPTIYALLLESRSALSEAERDSAEVAMARMRLMVSGSAALPMSVLDQWRAVSGHVLLERYGMTEFGMGLTNPYEAALREPGYVGLPFPRVAVRICDPASGAPVAAGRSGELRVKGPNMFACYWGKPEATAKEFDDEGWFKTGDVAVFDAEKNGARGAYRILGRASVDIIKSGGYKLSALEIERVMLEHPRIAEAVVLGVEDETWGQLVGAMVRLRQPVGAGVVVGV
jgi:malonyl-CoA/methylmalonyl-CoA synthetase